MIETFGCTAFVASRRPPSPVSKMTMSIFALEKCLSASAVVISKNVGCGSQSRTRSRIAGGHTAKRASPCRERVAARRPPRLSRYNGKITEQPAELFAHLFAMHNQIDQAMFLKKLGGLKFLRQILMGSFFDHAWAGEADHAFRFCNNHIT